MPSIRAMIDAGSRMLARRLNQLLDNLESIRGRLGSTIASAVGETIGMIVRDGALRILDEIPHYVPSDSFSHSYQTKPAYYQDSRGYWDDDDFEEEEDAPIQTSPTKPVRLPTALSAGLQAASWWARRWPAAKQPLTMLAVTLTATAAAFYGGPLVIVLFGLAHAATHFTSSA